MSDLNKKTVHYLADLSRIHCTEEEEEQILEKLKKIVDYVELLQEVDTENVPPCTNVHQEMHNVMRKDEVVSDRILPRERLLDNAPDKISGMIKVPPVIKKSS